MERLTPLVNMLQKCMAWNILFYKERKYVGERERERDRDRQRVLENEPSEGTVLWAFDSLHEKKPTTKPRKHMEENDDFIGLKIIIFFFLS